MQHAPMGKEAKFLLFSNRTVQMQHLTINLLLEKKKGEEYLRYVRRERDITFPFFLSSFSSRVKSRVILDAGRKSVPLISYYFNPVLKFRRATRWFRRCEKETRLICPSIRNFRWNDKRINGYGKQNFIGKKFFFSSLLFFFSRRQIAGEARSEVHFQFQLIKSGGSAAGSFSSISRETRTLLVTFTARRDFI